MTVRYYEDFQSGDSFALGQTAVTEAEIIAFAEQYDPQAFHTDPAAAAETSFDSLFASGWHTAALCMRELVDGLLCDTAVIGGVGVEELRWLVPLYAGDELHVSANVANKEEWDDERGLVTFAIEATNQNDETVIRFKDLALLERSAPD